MTPSAAAVPINTGRGRQLPEPAYRLLVAATAVGIAGMAWLRTPRYFYIDDTQSQGLPTMHLIGRLLREGEWRLLFSDLGVGGNLATDPQYGMYFPPKLLLSLYVSFFDDVRLAASLLSALFLAVLALGMVFALRASGVSRGWSSAAALATVSSGFILVWAAAGWQPALWAFSLIPWLWYFLITERYLVLVPGVALTCWLLVGFAFPFAAICGFLLIVCWSIVQIFARQHVRLAISATLAATAGFLLGVLNYLPLFLAADFTTRNSSLRNDAGLVPNLGDLFASWSPVATGEMHFWGGEVTKVPILFLGWFVLPIVPLIRWDRSLLRSQRVLEMTAFGACVILLSQLPSEVGPFRWPFRVIPAISIAAAALTALCASRVGLTVTRGRIGASFLLLFVGVWVQFGRTPADLVQIVVAAAIVAGLLLLLIGAVRRHRSGSLIANAGTIICAGVLLWALPSPGTNPEVLDFGYATHVSDLPSSPLAPDVRTLVLRTPTQSVDSDYAQGLTVGFVPTYQNRYPGISYFAVGQRPLQAALCQDFLGRVCPSAIDFLGSKEPRTGRRWQELLNYSQILVSDELFRASQFREWPVVRRLDGYRLLESPKKSVAEHVSFATPGVQISLQQESANELQFNVSGGAGSLIVLDEIYWPGWHAELNGQEIPISSLDEILVSANLPSTTENGLLTFTYRPVSGKLLFGVLALAAFCFLGALWVGRTVQRRTTNV